MSEEWLGTQRAGEKAEGEMRDPIPERCQGAAQRHFRLQIVDCRLAEGPAPDGELGRDGDDSRQLAANSLRQE